MHIWRKINVKCGGGLGVVVVPSVLVKRRKGRKWENSVAGSFKDFYPLTIFTFSLTCDIQGHQVYAVWGVRIVNN